MEKELPNRRPARLRDFNYNTAGAYFITICTENRERILSEIAVGGDVPDAPFRHSSGHILDVPLSDSTYLIKYI